MQTTYTSLHPSPSSTSAAPSRQPGSQQPVSRQYFHRRNPSEPCPSISRQHPDAQPHGSSPYQSPYQSHHHQRQLSQPTYYASPHYQSSAGNHFHPPQEQPEIAQFNKTFVSSRQHDHSASSQSSATLAPPVTFDQFGGLNTASRDQLRHRQEGSRADKLAKSPQLRQSASFAVSPYTRQMENVTPVRPEPSPSSSASNRVSDGSGGNNGSNQKPPRKKSGFSKFVNQVFGSPNNKSVISDPLNPVHLTHVEIDNGTGQFKVRLRRKPVRTVESGERDLAHFVMG